MERECVLHSPQIPLLAPDAELLAQFTANLLEIVYAPVRKEKRKQSRQTMPKDMMYII